MWSCRFPARSFDYMFALVDNQDTATDPLDHFKDMRTEQNRFALRSQFLQKLFEDHSRVGIQAIERLIEK